MRGQRGIYKVQFPQLFIFVTNKSILPQWLHPFRRCWEIVKGNETPVVCTRQYRKGVLYYSPIYATVWNRFSDIDNKPNNDSILDNKLKTRVDCFPIWRMWEWRGVYKVQFPQPFNFYHKHDRHLMKTAYFLFADIWILRKGHGTPAFYTWQCGREFFTIRRCMRRFETDSRILITLCWQ